MNLDELQSVRDRERQTDRLQQLRESFYEDAGELIQQLRRERERAAEQAEDPFDSTTVTQLTDEIRTAEQMVEAIYEKRIGKIVKAASFDAAGLPAEADGMTAEEQDLFDNLVRDIQQNRERVLEVIGGTGAGDVSAADDLGPPPAETDASEGVPAAAAMGGETTDDSGNDDAPSEPAPTPPPEREPPPDGSADDAAPDATSRTDATSGTAPVTDESQSDPDAEAPAREGDTDEGPDPDTDDESDTGGAGPSRDPDDDDDSPVREDGSGASSGPGRTASAGAGGAAEPATDDVRRKTVRILESVETFVGFDDRDYDLEDGDVVTLPATNADLLLDRGVARELD